VIVIAKELVKQLLKKPFTNLFPAKYAPKSIKQFLRDAKEGKVKLNPPVVVPPNFRGKIEYDEKKCIRCKLCTRVCPAKALEYVEKENIIKYHLFRCAFCGQCVDVCPTGALKLTKEFLLAGYKKD